MTSWGCLFFFKLKKAGYHFLVFPNVKCEKILFSFLHRMFYILYATQLEKYNVLLYSREMGYKQWLNILYIEIFFIDVEDCCVIWSYFFLLNHILTSGIYSLLFTKNLLVLDLKNETVVPTDKNNLLPKNIPILHLIVFFVFLIGEK